MFQQLLLDAILSASIYTLMTITFSLIYQTTCRVTLTKRDIKYKTLLRHDHLSGASFMSCDFYFVKFLYDLSL